jgi:hypothetical protein
MSWGEYDHLLGEGFGLLLGGGPRDAGVTRRAGELTAALSAQMHAAEPEQRAIAAAILPHVFALCGEERRAGR